MNKYEKETLTRILKKRQEELDQSNYCKYFYEFDLNMKDEVDGYETVKSVVAVYMHYNRRTNKNTYFVTSPEEYMAYLNNKIRQWEFTLQSNVNYSIDANAPLEDLRLLLEEKFNSFYMSPKREMKREFEEKRAQKDNERKFFWMDRFDTNKKAQTAKRKEFNAFKKEHSDIKFKTTKQIEEIVRKRLNVLNIEELSEMLEKQLKSETRPAEKGEIMQMQLSLLFLQKLKWEGKYNG